MSTAAAPIRILLIDDHAILRAGVRMLINTHPGMEVVAEASSRDEALAAVAQVYSDLILLDLDLGGASSLNILPRLLHEAPAARVLILTGMRDPEWHHRAVRLGAMGVVLKEQVIESLIEAIERVSAGQFWVDPATSAIALTQIAQQETSKRAFEADKIATLTAREREIIRLVGEGLKNQQIAHRLFISHGTVRNHLSIIFEKLGLADRLELVVYAYRHGLVPPPA